MYWKNLAWTLPSSVVNRKNWKAEDEHINAPKINMFVYKVEQTTDIYFYPEAKFYLIF